MGFLSTQGLIVLISNFIVLAVIMTLFVLSLLKFIKERSDGRFLVTFFLFVYSIFLIVQNSHLLSIAISNLPFTPKVYTLFCFTVQSIIAVCIWYLGGYFTFKDKKGKLIVLGVCLAYLAVVISLMAVLYPCNSVLDPVTQLYDMDIGSPVSYLHYTALTIDVGILIYLIVKGFLVKDKELARQLFFAAIGFTLFILGLVARAIGMHLALTITRKLLICLGAFILYNALTPFAFVPKLFKTLPQKEGQQKEQEA